MFPLVTGESAVHVATAELTIRSTAFCVNTTVDVTIHDRYVPFADKV